MPPPEPLLPSQYYHIYNRGNGGECLFRQLRNYPYFLKLYAQYIEPIAETYAYCLLRNHFHFLLPAKDNEGDQWPDEPVLLQDTQARMASKAFANLFGTYTKAFNKAYRRTGSLFEKPSQRKRVENDRHFAALVVYIHHNPQRHGLVDDFRRWPHSSYQAVLVDKPTHLRRSEVLAWFDGHAGVELAHGRPVQEAALGPLVAADF
jgi:hypothetical protein